MTQGRLGLYPFVINKHNKNIIISILFKLFAKTITLRLCCSPGLFRPCELFYLLIFISNEFINIIMSELKKIDVRCYSGYKANECPVSFSIGDKSLNVEQLIDKWYGPDYTYFKLLADDGNSYILKYDERKDEWELDFFQNKKVKDGKMKSE
jgi:hypothetical protein